jgi:hypothetical protein
MAYEAGRLYLTVGSVKGARHIEAAGIQRLPHPRIALRADRGSVRSVRSVRSVVYRSNRMTYRFLPLFFLLLICRPVAAWNVAGHMVSASIAFDVLNQDDPQTLARLLDMLRQHPQYASHFADKLEAVASEDRDRYLFMLAARWPDDVRRNAEYHRGPWHYVNFPFKPAGQPAWRS